MHVTTRFVGTQRGGVPYLIYLLTEEYIEANQKIAQEITPALERFARDLGGSGTLVRPFPGVKNALWQMSPAGKSSGTREWSGT